MNAAHKLYEMFTKSTDPKVIIETAYEIKKHFANVSEKEPADEIGEEFIFLIGGKKESFEWLLLLIILYINVDGYEKYLEALAKKKNQISIKQSEWARIILKEINAKIIEFYNDDFSNLFSLIANVKSDNLHKKEKLQNKISFWKKLFGEKEELIAKSDTINFIKLQDAISFKPKVANWIRKQNSPLGNLFWFAVPSGKNQYYQPCFGIFTDSVLFDKLERAETFNLNCSINNIPLTFKWSVVFGDPDNSGNQITLNTNSIEVDEYSLAKLNYIAEHVQLHYFFYVSAESSNFVWMEMGPEFNEKLSQLYLSLKNKQADISNTLEEEHLKQESPVVHIGPKIPPLKLNNEHSEDIKVGDTSLTLEDGTIIQISDIKEVADGRQVIGASSHSIMRAINSELEKGHGVVYLLYVTNNRPSTAIIPIENHSNTAVLIEQIKNARDFLKKKKREVTKTKEEIGKCEKCGRTLRAKIGGLKEKMHITCKCGAISIINVPNVLLEEHGLLKIETQKDIYSDSSTDIWTLLNSMEPGGFINPYQSEKNAKDAYEKLANKANNEKLTPPVSIELYSNRGIHGLIDAPYWIFIGVEKYETIQQLKLDEFKSDSVLVGAGGEWEAWSALQFDRWRGSLWLIERIVISNDGTIHVLK